MSKRRSKTKSYIGIRKVEAAGVNLERFALDASAAIEVLQAAEGQPAKRPTFSINAYNGGKLSVRGSYYPVVIDLAGLRANRVTVLRDHDPTQIVGQGTAAITAANVTVNGEITGDAANPSEAAHSIVSHARNGFVWAASVGVSVERIEKVDAGANVTVNGQVFAGPLGVVRAGRLGEVSFVGIGADETSSAKIAASAANSEEKTMNAFEKWLTAMGLVNDALTDDQRVKLQAKFDMEQKAAPVVEASGTGRDVDAIIAAAKAKRERIRQINAIIEEAASIRGADLDALDTLAARANDEDMPVKDLELAVLRLSRPKPIIGTRPPPPPANAMLEAAALLSTGHRADSLVGSHGAQIVEAAQKQFKGGIGLQELVMLCAQANGYSGRGRITAGNWREFIGWATPPSIQAAGFSTVDLTGILGNVANKALAAIAGELQWVAPQICGVASHSNFHSHTVYSLAMNGELLPVGPTGELKHLALAEESYTRQVGTRGAILRLSRTDIVNDDLGVFARNAASLSRKALATREKALFTIINATAAGSSHFTAARGNYVSGAGTALGADGMANAIQTFRNMTGPDGDPIMVEPAIVLVPSTLEDPARRLLAAGSQTVVVATNANYTAADQLASNANIYGGRFGGRPLVSPWLEAASLSGFSVAKWYLLADPNQYPCFEIAYLNGQQTPTVEYFGLEADADVLGMTWRVYWDFGVGTAEWRAGVKSAGA